MLNKNSVAYKYAQGVENTFFDEFFSFFINKFSFTKIQYSFDIFNEISKIKFHPLSIELITFSMMIRKHENTIEEKTD